MMRARPSHVFATALVLGGATVGCGGATSRPTASTTPSATITATPTPTVNSAVVTPLEVNRQACTRGHALSCLRAAFLLDAQAAAEPAATAATTFDRAMSLRLTGCELGLRAACYSAAVQLRTERGIALDEELAGRLSQLSCSDGLCGARFDDLIADHERSGTTTLANDYLDRRVPLPADAFGIGEVTLIVNHRDVVAPEAWTLTCTAERAGVPSQVSVELPRSPLEYEAVQVWGTIVTVPKDLTLTQCYAQYPNASLTSSRVWVGVRGRRGK
jgi:hypothetical protein